MKMENLLIHLLQPVLTYLTRNLSISADRCQIPGLMAKLIMFKSIDMLFLPLKYKNCLMKTRVSGLAQKKVLRSNFVCCILYIVYSSYVWQKKLQVLLN